VKFFIYTVLFSILFSLFAKLQVYVNYFVNQQYYAEVLCENKEVKESCCHGKCAMEKELVTLNEKEQEQPAKNDNSVLKITKVEQAVSHSISSFMNVVFISFINTPFSGQPEKGIFTTLFKPPTRLVA